MKRIVLIAVLALVLVGCDHMPEGMHRECYTMTWDHDEGSYFSGKTTKRWYRGEQIKVCDYVGGK